MGAFTLCVENTARDIQSLLTLHKVHPKVCMDVHRRMATLIEKSYEQMAMLTPCCSESSYDVCRAIAQHVIDRTLEVAVPLSELSNVEHRVSEGEQRVFELKEQLKVAEEQREHSEAVLGEVTRAHNTMLHSYFREVLVLRYQLEDHKKKYFAGGGGGGGKGFGHSMGRPTSQSGLADDPITSPAPDANRVGTASSLDSCSPGLEPLRLNSQHSPMPPPRDSNDESSFIRLTSGSRLGRSSASGLTSRGGVMQRSAAAMTWRNVHLAEHIVPTAAVLNKNRAETDSAIFDYEVYIKMMGKAQENYEKKYRLLLQERAQLLSRQRESRVKTMLDSRHTVEESKFMLTELSKQLEASRALSLMSEYKLKLCAEQIKEDLHSLLEDIRQSVFDLQASYHADMGRLVEAVKESQSRSDALQDFLLTYVQAVGQLVQVVYDDASAKTAESFQSDPFTVIGSMIPDFFAQSAREPWRLKPLLRLAAWEDGDASGIAESLATMGSPLSNQQQHGGDGGELQSVMKPSGKKGLGGRKASTHHRKSLVVIQEPGAGAAAAAEGGEGDGQADGDTVAPVPPPDPSTLGYDSSAVHFWQGNAISNRAQEVLALFQSLAMQLRTRKEVLLQRLASREGSSRGKTGSRSGRQNHSARGMRVGSSSGGGGSAGGRLGSSRGGRRYETLRLDTQDVDESDLLDLDGTGGWPSHTGSIPRLSVHQGQSNQAGSGSPLGTSPPDGRGGFNNTSGSSTGARRRSNRSGTGAASIADGDSSGSSPPSARHGGGYGPNSRRTRGSNSNTSEWKYSPKRSVGTAGRLSTISTGADPSMLGEDSTAGGRGLPVFPRGSFADGVLQAAAAAAAGHGVAGPVGAGYSAVGHSTDAFTLASTMHRSIAASLYCPRCHACITDDSLELAMEQVWTLHDDWLDQRVDDEFRTARELLETLRRLRFRRLTLQAHWRIASQRSQPTVLQATPESPLPAHLGPESPQAITRRLTHDTEKAVAYCTTRISALLLKLKAHILAHSSVMLCPIQKPVSPSVPLLDIMDSMQPPQRLKNLHHSSYLRTPLTDVGEGPSAKSKRRSAANTPSSATSSHYVLELGGRRVPLDSYWTEPLRKEAAAREREAADRREAQRELRRRGMYQSPYGAVAGYCSGVQQGVAPLEAHRGLVHLKFDEEQRRFFVTNEFGRPALPAPSTGDAAEQQPPPQPSANPFAMTQILVPAPLSMLPEAFRHGIPTSAGGYYLISDTPPPPLPPPDADFHSAAPPGPVPLHQALAPVTLVPMTIPVPPEEWALRGGGRTAASPVYAVVSATGAPQKHKGPNGSDDDEKEDGTSTRKQSPLQYLYSSVLDVALQQQQQNQLQQQVQKEPSEDLLGTFHQTSAAAEGWIPPLPRVARPRGSGEPMRIRAVGAEDDEDSSRETVISALQEVKRQQEEKLALQRAIEEKQREARQAEWDGRGDVKEPIEKEKFFRLRLPAMTSGGSRSHVVASAQPRFAAECQKQWATKSRVDPDLVKKPVMPKGEI